MKMLSYNKSDLLGKIDILSPEGKVAFAAACAERIFPTYVKFNKDTGEGNPASLAEILNRLWADLSGLAMTATELAVNIEKCDSLIPDPEGPYTVYRATAEDTVTALIYALKCRESGSSKEAALAGLAVYETLDNYVINKDDIDISIPGIGTKIIAHPLIQKELSRQARDLIDITNGSITFEQLRNRAKDESKEFLGILL